jgi:hypothetical protein
LGGLVDTFSRGSGSRAKFDNFWGGHVSVVDDEVDDLNASPLHFVDQIIDAS